MSMFSDVPLCPPDAIFEVARRFREDTSPLKMDLGIGAYRDSNGKPWKLPVISKAEQLILADTSRNYQYLPISGSERFINHAVSLILGKNSQTVVNETAGGIQCLSGTGALRIAAEFLKRFHRSNTVMLSNPTWGNHASIMKDAGLDVKHYRYWNSATCGLDFDGMISDLRAAHTGSIVVLHACAHNPTGVDPSLEQWTMIAALCQEKELFVLFDCAYQGFASGDLNRDATAVRMFVAAGVELFVAQSFSKNFGIYNQRAGCLTVVLSNRDARDNVLSQMKVIARPMYSNPPEYGSSMVTAILDDSSLTTEWHENLRVMSSRIIAMRKAIYDAVIKNGTPGDWTHFIKQIGMFCFTGLKPEQVDIMESKHHIYMLRNGRVSMAGVNEFNVQHFADAIHDVTVHYASS